VLDDVERRRFLVQPARKDSAHALVRTLDVDLHESARQLLHLPRGGLLASAEPDDQVLPSPRLAGAHGDVADDSIALVQYPEDSDALGHRRDARGAGAAGGVFGSGRIALLLAVGPVAAKQREAKRGQKAEAHGHAEPAHSGVQGS
jgi:hypothetical protein